MKCKKCGKELESDWKICPVCGEPAEETSGSKELIKKKKPVYKKIWFWVLVVFVCFIGLAVYGSTLPDEGEEQKSTENKVTDFSEYDFKELLSQPESEAKSIGLEKKGKENIYTGLDEEIQVVYKEGVVQTIQIKGEGAKTPTFYGVRIGMEKTEIDGKLKENYSEKIEAESEQKFINLQTKESVICGIAEGKVNTITFQKLSDEEIAEYQKVKEEQLRAQYIFPDSDSKYLSEDEVRSVEADKLAFGRNEIFARHGYIFKGEEFQKYFESTSWYEGTVPNDQFDSEKVFNDFEKKNVELIQKVEDEMNGPSKEEVERREAIDGAYNFVAGRAFHMQDSEMAIEFTADGGLIALGYYGSAPREDKYTTYSFDARYEVYKDDVYEWLVFVNIEGVEYYFRYFEGGSINLTGNGEFDGWYDLYY